MIDKYKQLIGLKFNVHKDDANIAKIRDVRRNEENDYIQFYISWFKNGKLAYGTWEYSDEFLDVEISNEDIIEALYNRTEEEKENKMKLANMEFGYETHPLIGAEFNADWGLGWEDGTVTGIRHAEDGYVEIEITISDGRKTWIDGDSFFECIGSTEIIEWMSTLSGSNATKKTETPEVKINHLDLLFIYQKKLMMFLGVPELREGDEYLTHPAFKAVIDGIVTEAAEVLDAISVMTKPWKQKPIEEIREHMTEEAVDVVFMLLEMFIFMNIDSDMLLKLYTDKLVKNLGRLEKAGRGSDEMKAFAEEFRNA